MFSNNNRISTRQVFRLFVFEFVGESTLILPSQLAAFAGNDGLASIVLGGITGMNIQLGGTSLLIVVGVALDTARQMESFMLMRHHKGFLE